MNVSEILLPWPGWRIIRPLGKGAYGTVYEAVKQEYGVESRSAIKIMHIPADDSELDMLHSDGYTEVETEKLLEDMVNECGTEISLMVSLKGLQNIVSVEDFKILKETDKIGWTIYIRMELLTPFSMVIRDCTPDEKEVIKLGCDICTALEYCSEQNIIHRDIKPANIFVNNFGDYKLGDFGIARSLENVTSTLSAKGTFYYMAPEVANREKYDATIDTYSLGLVMYFLLNQKRHPFVEQSGSKINYRDLEAALNRRLAREVLPPPCNASEAMRAVILRACAPNPKDRFSSPKELKLALKRVLNGNCDQIWNQNYVHRSEEYEKTIKSPETLLEKTQAVSVGTYVNREDGGIQRSAIKAVKKKSKAPMIAGVIGAAALCGAAAFYAGTGYFSKDRADEPEEAILVESTAAADEQSVESQAEPMTSAETSTVPSTEPAVWIENEEQALFYEQCGRLQNIAIGDTILYGSYEQDNNRSNGKEEIAWRVLDKQGDNVFVISEKALACHPYENDYIETTWADSLQRSWLNGEFLANAFSIYQQDLILDTDVSADWSKDYSTDPGQNTVDKIFLLSNAEAEYYFKGDADRLCEASVYAKVQGAYMMYSKSWWWLRTTGKDRKHMSLIYCDGTVRSEGYRTNVKDGVIRPAMWLDLSDIKHVEVPQDLLPKKTTGKAVIAIDAAAVGTEADVLYTTAKAPSAEYVERHLDTGAAGISTGVRESSVNLGVSKYLADELLARSYQVVMLREDNEALTDESERAVAAAQAGADILLIVSCSRNTEGRGASALAPGSDNADAGQLSSESARLADNILSGYCAKGIFENNGVYSTNEVAGINWSKIPVTNLLLGSLVDPSDEQKLADESNWEIMAAGIADGVDRYCQ